MLTEKTMTRTKITDPFGFARMKCHKRKMTARQGDAGALFESTMGTVAVVTASAGITPAEPAGDCGIGILGGGLEPQQAHAVEAILQRLAFKPHGGPLTGADLGAGALIDEE